MGNFFFFCLLRRLFIFLLFLLLLHSRVNLKELRKEDAGYALIVEAKFIDHTFRKKWKNFTFLDNKYAFIPHASITKDNIHKPSLPFPTFLTEHGYKNTKAKQCINYPCVINNFLKTIYAVVNFVDYHSHAWHFQTVPGFSFTKTLCFNSRPNVYAESFVFQNFFGYRDGLLPQISFVDEKKKQIVYSKATF